jgi:hypothetical protein
LTSKISDPAGSDNNIGWEIVRGADDDLHIIGSQPERLQRRFGGRSCASPSRCRAPW